MWPESPSRTRVLACTCGGVFVAALSALVSPTAGNRPLTAHKFPEESPLAGWELVGTDALRDERKDIAHTFNVVQSGQRYRYVRDGIPLDAEIRYVVRTAGDAGLLLTSHTAIPRRAFEGGELRRHGEIGDAILFSHDDRAYLDACINPRGGTTVTTEQFLAAHRARDFSVRRGMLWLLGRESLQDHRCLWVHLSTPAPGEELTAAFSRLQAVWVEWRRPWQSHFPSY